MNQFNLSIKIRIICIFVGVLSAYFAFAESSDPDTSFIDLCKSSDAYYLYSYTDVSYTKLWSSYRTQVAFQSKLVINNKAGVDKFAFLKIDQSFGDRLNHFRVRTLKADGTTVELDSSLVFDHKSDIEVADQKGYPIPGVEPGDTIEVDYKYTQRLKAYDARGYVALFNEAPSLNSEYSVTVPSKLTVIYKLYNDFREPQVFTNDTIVYCLFKMENVRGIELNEYSCMFCELPYAFYSVDEKGSEKRTWKDVYNQEFNSVTQPLLLDYEKSSYYRKWKRKILENVNDSSKYYKLRLLLDDVYKNMEVGPAQESEIFKSSGYFLKEKRFDPTSIRRLYRQILEDLEIDYWAVFAKSKHYGEIDPYFIRKGEFDHVFFAFENAENGVTLLYPHTSFFKYLVGEIPTELYNTDAVITKPFIDEKLKKIDKFINIDLKLAEVDSVTINVVRLPAMGTSVNSLKNVLYCNVDTESRNVSVKSTLYLSGGISTDIRSFYAMLSENEEMNNFYDALSEYEGDESPLAIDSVWGHHLDSISPFRYRVELNGKLKGGLSFINDSLVSLKLENLINHGEVESKGDSTSLNYYMNYSFTDLFVLYLEFPCDIELLGVDQPQRSVKSQFCDYTYNLTQIGNNRVLIQSNYRILQDLIPKNELGRIKDINNLLQEIKNMRLLLKLKESDV